MMFKLRAGIMGAIFMCMAILPVLSAGESEEGVNLDDLKKEVDGLRKKLESPESGAKPVVAPVDRILENKYGPDATATTRIGRLKVGGLLQVWFYNIQNDNKTWLDADQLLNASGANFGSNELADNDSFRVRRAQLRFTLDIHENVTACVMIDPACEAQPSFPDFPSNQGTGESGYSDVFFDGAFLHPRPTADDAACFCQPGVGHVTRPYEPTCLLQDAYINYHGVIPHHDFTIGQFRRHLGEEGTRDDGELDFVERAMITQPASVRDLGVQAHGTWWDDRLHYWIGGFDGAGTAFQNRSNRSDDNDNKDLCTTMLIRPLWKDHKWGGLELGYSLMYGLGGEAGGHQPADNPVNGLNRRQTVHMMQNAWGVYKPGGPVRGWWMRGEWGLIRDRFAPDEVATGLYVYTANPAPFNIQGWYVSTGYRISDSKFADCNSWLRSLEFAFRYDVMQNLFHHDLVYPSRRLDVFKTQVFTAGVNYYLKGDNVKFQLNYNLVDERDDVDDTNGRQVREVKNNSIVLGFQVGF